LNGGTSCVVRSTFSILYISYVLSSRWEGGWCDGLVPSLYKGIEQILRRQDAIAAAALGLATNVLLS